MCLIQRNKGCFLFILIILLMVLSGCASKRTILLDLKGDGSKSEIICESNNSWKVNYDNSSLNREPKPTNNNDIKVLEVKEYLDNNNENGLIVIETVGWGGENTIPKLKVYDKNKDVYKCVYESQENSELFYYSNKLISKGKEIYLYDLGSTSNKIHIYLSVGGMESPIYKLLEFTFNKQEKQGKLQEVAETYAPALIFIISDKLIIVNHQIYDSMGIYSGTLNIVRMIKIGEKFCKVNPVIDTGLFHWNREGLFMQKNPDGESFKVHDLKLIDDNSYLNSYKPYDWRGDSSFIEVMRYIEDYAKQTGVKIDESFPINK